MPTPRFFQRRPPEEKPWSLLHHFAKEWQNAGIVLAILVIGGVISFFFLRSPLPGVDEGMRLIVFCGFVSTLGYMIDTIETRRSRQALIWRCSGLLTLAIVGAFSGSILLPSMWPLFSKAFFGALIGLAVPGPLIAAYQEGMALQQKH